MLAALLLCTQLGACGTLLAVAVAVADGVGAVELAKAQLTNQLQQSAAHKDAEIQALQAKLAAAGHQTRNAGEPDDGCEV